MIVTHPPAKRVMKCLLSGILCAGLAWIHGLFICGLATSRDHGESIGGEDREQGVVLVDKLSFRHGKGDGPV